MSIAGPPRFDLTYALLSGPLSWRDSEVPVSVTERAACFAGQLGAAVFTALAIAEVAESPTWGRAGLLGGIVVLVAVLDLGLVRTLRGYGDSEAPTVIFFVARTAAFVGLILTWSWMTGPAELLELWPMGILAGADAYLTMRALGVQVLAREWVFRFVPSPIHLGVAIGLLAYVLMSDDPNSRRGALFVLACLYLVVGTSVVVIASLERLRVVEWAARTELEDATVAREHGRRSQWVHDRVCAELRRTRLLIERDDALPPSLAVALDDLDHNLRLLQLDELISSGTARLADVIQPFVRDVQNRGVAIAAVPRAEEAMIELGPAAARELRRALGVFVTNAVNAGATSIEFVVSRRDVDVDVHVIDNAAGFDPVDLPLGRGLERLRHDVGPGRIALRSGLRGTDAIITVAGPRQ